METIEVLPNPSDLIESMRSIGYSFNTAIADIIDNSISAHAKKIDIYSIFSDNTLQKMQIIDDGDGMDLNGLIEAMRLGSKNPNDLREKEDLGRFGLGLKSASFSQCRCLTVVTCQNGRYNALVWDLDYVQEHNCFEVQQLTNGDIKKIDHIDSIKEHGTIVQWSKFDYFNSKEQMFEKLANAKEHLSLIFHRYIEDGLKMTLNNMLIEAKDPFLKKNSRTQILQSKKINMGIGIVEVQPYILPQIKYLSQEERAKVNGITKSNTYTDQGLYIYRNKRLIMWGTYLHLDSPKELNKNARIQVDIPNTLDSLWEIDVKKSKASIPHQLRKQLRAVVKNSSEQSKRIYKYRGHKSITNNSPIWNFTIFDNYHSIFKQFSRYQSC